MGCVASNNEILTQEQLATILSKPPIEWTHRQVIQWLEFTHDGDLKDLVLAFKLEKISGPSFVKITDSILENKLNIQQFGLRDAFIAARNKLLTSNHSNNDSITSNINNKSKTINSSVISANNSYQPTPLQSYNNNNINNSNINFPSNDDIYDGLPLSLMHSINDNTNVNAMKMHMNMNMKMNSINANNQTLTNTFRNMQKKTFQDDGVHEDENYVCIDPADLNDNIQIQSNVNYTNSNHPSNNGHHTQTDSNYDELPMEFMDNIHNPLSNEINTTIGINVGYQEIKFNERDDNVTHKGANVFSQKHIHEFARDLWKTLHKINVKTVADSRNEPIRGFSGKTLVSHVKTHLQNMNNVDIRIKCNDLVKYKYIRLIASTKDTRSNISSDQIQDFVDSEKYLYQFENEKHKEFIKENQPDRRAWTRDTKVEIYSSTLGGWCCGIIVEVNNDELTITYGQPTQQMQKILDRYQNDLVRSTQQFIENRRTWKKDDAIEIYSHAQRTWCSGRIEEILFANENQPMDVFHVFYSNNDKCFRKYVDRWSPDLRDIQQLSPKLAKYKKGTKVRVWSNSQNIWIPGVVICVVPTHEVVNVKYGDHEKLVRIDSDDLKLIHFEEKSDVDKNDNDNDTERVIKNIRIEENKSNNTMSEPHERSQILLKLKTIINQAKANMVVMDELYTNLEQQFLAENQMVSNETNQTSSVVSNNNGSSHGSNQNGNNTHKNVKLNKNKGNNEKKDEDDNDEKGNNDKTNNYKPLLVQCNHLNECKFCINILCGKYEAMKMFKALIQSLQKQHEYHMAFEDMITRAQLDKKARVKFKKNTKQIQKKQMNQISYDPPLKHFKISRVLTNKIMPNTIKYSLSNPFKYLLKTIAMQCNDGEIILEDDEKGVNDLRVINIDLNDKQSNNLFCIAKKNKYNWELYDQLYTKEELSKLSIVSLPASSRHKLQYKNDIVLKNINKLVKYCKWKEVSVYNKQKLHTTQRMTLSITKEKLNPIIKETLENVNKNNSNKLIPILMFDKNSHWIEYICIVKIKDNINIGISLRMTNKSLKITGVHLDKQMILEQHELVYEHNCHCLDGFISEINDIQIGNPNDLINQVKSYKQRYEQLKQYVEKFRDEKLPEKICALQKQADLFIKNDNGNLSLKTITSESIPELTIASVSMISSVSSNSRVPSAYYSQASHTPRILQMDED